METEYKIIRSKRKSIGLEIRPDCRILVRAPYYISNAHIEQFVREHEAWIAKHLEKARKQAEIRDLTEKLSEAEIKKLAEQAAKYIPQRAAYYAGKIGVTYGRITIRKQRTRWGSCSAKGNLNFNCLLMLAPPEVIDSVIVHELCHRKEMNHSKKFYEEVEKVFPDYKKWHRWLKDNGAGLLAKL